MVQQADNERLKEAFAHYQAGRLDEARAVSLAMLEQQPHQVEAMQILGIIARQTGAYDRASSYYQQAISIKLDYPEAYNNLGASFREQGKIERAIAAYKQAITVKPDRIDAYNNLALALERQEKRTGCPRTVKSELYNSLGEVLREKGKIAAAKEKFKQAISLKPDDYEALNNLAFVFVAEKQLERAAELFQRKWR
ncbi:MAG: tetratricopeptide repeat protein [Hormoscilla sp. SP12CHS1]|nr:tetratricopeptide repeat protein [Hormoscilla sp. SP12CHS1]